MDGDRTRVPGIPEGAFSTWRFRLPVAGGAIGRMEHKLVCAALTAGRQLTPMSAVQITGMSGTGKTTIAVVLARQGLAAIDADDDHLLSRNIDSNGNVVEDVAVPDFAWLARHSWEWNPARLDELIGAAAPAPLHVCGCADNELELADRFTQVFLLEIDEPTMLARLASRDKEFGRIGDTREYQRRKLPEYQSRLRASGAIPIDARRPLDQVVATILSHTSRSVETT